MGGLDPIDVIERLVRLETKVEQLDSMAVTLSAIDKKLARYEGRWGVITIIGTALWAMFTVFKDDIFAFFGHK